MLQLKTQLAAEKLATLRVQYSARDAVLGALAAADQKVPAEGEEQAGAELPPRAVLTLREALTQAVAANQPPSPPAPAAKNSPAAAAAALEAPAAASCAGWSRLAVGDSSVILMTPPVYPY